MKKIIISSIVSLILGGIFYYFLLPPINIQSLFFWFFIGFILIMFMLTYLIAGITIKGEFKGNLKPFEICTIVLGLIILGIIMIDIILSPLFNSKGYSKRIKIDDNGEFTKDVAPVDFNSIPLLDKDSSQKLGDRVMGQMPEMVSQFYVSDLYTQINYDGEIVRVTPLEYNGFFKYLNNHKKGITGYITVNSVNGAAKLVKLDKGMKYMPSAIFNEDLDRHLRFKYPFAIFGDETFEVDNNGNPYWIVPTIKYSGVGLKKEINGVIILDPITGKSKKYKVKDVPSWVDHVYSASLIIDQVDDWGEYKTGFLNSIFGQKNVVMTTDGYNYTVIDDDVYLYTGITSVAADESNIGFIMTNMRTKKTSYYAVPGAEEYSAMASAEGQVQEKKYLATFPLLINLNNKPTYLISLKDNAGLVKKYAFVDVENYQKVVVSDVAKGIKAASENYLNEIAEDEDISIKDFKSKTITISKINTAIIDNATYYFIVDNELKKYKVSIKTNDSILPFLEEGDTITVSYIKEKEVTSITKIER